MPLESRYEPIKIERKSGGQGAPILWAVISTSNDVGYIQPVGGSESFQEGKAGERVEFRMYQPISNTSIKYGDRITQNSQKYVVVFSLQPTGISSEGHHYEPLLGVFE